MLSCKNHVTDRQTNDRQFAATEKHDKATPKTTLHCGSKKNAPTLADYNYDPVHSILIIFSKLFVNDHKSCLVVKFSTSPHICCHYTL